MIKCKIPVIFVLFFFFLSGCGQEAHNYGLDSESEEMPTTITEKLLEETPEPEEKKPEEELPAEDIAAAVPVLAAGQAENKSLSWWLRPNLNHTTPGIAAEAEQMLSKYQAFYTMPDDGSQKIYLTFDEGYEFGYTPEILDTLKANNVKAAFFITGHYLTSQPELVKRMVNEGHMVVNHTWNHPNLPSATPDKISSEILSLAEEFEILTNTPMAKYIRPPEGAYSEASLSTTSQLDYKTVFWSLAFKDWDTKNQPGKDFSYNYVMDHIHPGAVILLHAVSQSNTEALNDIIVDLQNAGYVFALFE